MSNLRISWRFLVPSTEVRIVCNEEYVHLVVNDVEEIAVVVIYAIDTDKYNTQVSRVPFLSLHEITSSKLLTIFNYCASLWTSLTWPGNVMMVLKIRWNLDSLICWQWWWWWCGWWWRGWWWQWWWGLGWLRRTCERREVEWWAFSTDVLDIVEFDTLRTRNCN